MIDIYSLNNRKKDRDKYRNEIYKNILERCHNKIKHTANTHIGQQYVYFTVPRILVGYPIFDREKCSLYIVKKL